MRPPGRLSLRDREQKNRSRIMALGEIINERCTKPTTHTLLRYLKTEPMVIALPLRTHLLTHYRISRDCASWISTKESLARRVAKSAL
jgi:hypothetical protein